MPRDLSVPRTKTEQPVASSTRKAQKSYQAREEYDASPINAEFDNLHERINKVLVEAQVDDVATGASTATCVTKINEILDILRQAGLLKE